MGYLLHLSDQELDTLRGMLCEWSHEYGPVYSAAEDRIFELVGLNATASNDALKQGDAARPGVPDQRGHDHAPTALPPALHQQRGGDE